MSKKPKTWGTDRRGVVRPYEYKSLDEIQSYSTSSPGKKRFVVNVYGVVIDVTPVRKSKGLDYFCCIRIVDDQFNEGSGIKVTLFHSDEDKLPVVSGLDVIRLHRMKVDIYMGEVTLISSRGWSWVAWERNNVEVVDDGKSCSATWTVLESDKQRVEELREWVNHHSFPNYEPANPTEPATERWLSEVKAGAYFDWNCKVVAVSTEHNATLVIKAMDGTIPADTIDDATIDEGVEFVTLPGLESHKEYIVDVSVFDNHIETIENLNIKPGSMVRFTNLHASMRRDNCQKSDHLTELFLHGGLSYNRGITLLDTNSEKLKKLQASLEGINKDSFAEDAEFSEERSSLLKRASSPPLDASIKKIKLSPAPSASTDDGFQTPQHQRMMLPTVDVSPFRPSDSLASLPKDESFSQGAQNTLSMLMGLGKSGDGTLTSFDLTEASQSTLDSQEVLTQDSGKELRCHIDSKTVVYGDSSPLKVSTIAEVEAADVPLSTSKMFRIQIRIRKCHNAPDSLVYHHCPATGLYVAATNDGKPLSLSNSAHQWVTKWREKHLPACPRDGDREERVEDSLETSAEDEVQGTQWFLPEAEIQMFHHQHVKDGSRWEGMNVNGDVIRKRKLGDSKFSILYVSDYSKGFKKFAKRYDRVIHVVTKSQMTSSRLPPVVYQRGIYYYCSPGCVETVAIPTLSQEAESFRPSPVEALSCPLLVLTYHVAFTLCDVTGALDACLRGLHAVEFFNGATPREYLADPGLRKSLQDDLSWLCRDQESLMEVVVEKKCRASTKQDGAPVVFYEIINTRLRQW